MDRQHQRAAHATCDGRDIADEIEIELLVERRIDGVWRTNQKQRVTVGGRMHDCFGGCIAAGARPVLDDERVAEPLRQPLTDQTRENVVGAAGSKADDHAHRLRRIGLRPGFCAGHPRTGRKRDRTGSQTEKLPTQQGHDVVLWRPPVRAS